MPTDKRTRSKKPVAGQLGVVTKNIALIREQPDPRAELATQAVIGRPVVIEGGQKDWLFVQGWDTCRGWITSLLRIFSNSISRSMRIKLWSQR